LARYPPLAGRDTPPIASVVALPEAEGRKHKVAEMKKPSGPSVERLTEAPIIYCDTIPTVSLNSGIVDLTLAATLTEVPDGIERKRLVVVADLKMPLSTAISLRDLLDKIALAAQPTPGPSN
jgi:hypothetical protein